MDLTNLKSKIKTVAQMDKTSLNVFFLMRDDSGENILKRANIIQDVKKDLVDSYKTQLNNLIMDDDLHWNNLSSADDRSNVIYMYDIDEQPQLFKNFPEILKQNNQTEEQRDYFTFGKDDLSKLEGYFVQFGDADNFILIYRKQMPINLFKQGKIYLIKGHENQFDKIDKEFLRIDSKIDIIKVGDDILINNINILERHYEFKNIIESEANLSITNIESLKILKNVEVLKERVTDTTFARKLAKISTDSPVFKLHAKVIIEFVIDHKTLGKELRFTKKKKKIILDTKVSQNYFLKLMNDDFLHSELTEYDYMTPAKDRL